MNRIPIAQVSAIAIGCLIGFSIVGLAQQDRQAMVTCMAEHQSQTYCRLLISGR
jgi:hypothetical protein